jgi:hypothetical protein
MSEALAAVSSYVQFKAKRVSDTFCLTPGAKNVGQQLLVSSE